jgi:hypothetical protein
MNTDPHQRHFVPPAWAVIGNVRPHKNMARTSKELVVCVKNDDYPVSLELRKLYVALPDAKAAAHGHLRVIDESGEAYLYPRELFIAIDLPQPIRRRVLQVA